MGACVFTLMAAKVGKENTLYAAVMIGGIISGIGFFARGAVMQEEDGKNTNQPTAATVWISAAIGVTAGMMQLPLAFAITVIVVATTCMTEKVNKRVQQHRNRKQ
jgi:putative Mg2+ transporter-C (MgtC) family protein